MICESPQDISPILHPTSYTLYPIHLSLWFTISMLVTLHCHPSLSKVVRHDLSPPPPSTVSGHSSIRHLPRRPCHALTRHFRTQSWIFTTPLEILKYLNGISGLLLGEIYAKLRLLGPKSDYVGSKDKWFDGGLVTSMQIMKNIQLIAKAQDIVLFTEFENFQWWFKDVWFKQFPQQ